MRLVAKTLDPATQLRPHSQRLRGGVNSRPSTASSGGFTLVELMLVVAIIGIVAMLTIPDITRRMQERRASEAGQRIALMYQTARTQAMGRGTAVLVRYKSANSSFEVQEAQRGPGVAAGCEALPDPRCNDKNWNDPNLHQFRPVTNLALGQRAEYTHVTAEMIDPSNGNPTFLDVCFTPMGRTFFRQTDIAIFQPLTSIYRIDVYRDDGTGNALGANRTVMILPNGGARLQ